MCGGVGVVSPVEYPQHEEKYLAQNEVEEIGGAVDHELQSL